MPPFGNKVREKFSHQGHSLGNKVIDLGVIRKDINSGVFQSANTLFPNAQIPS